MEFTVSRNALLQALTHARCVIRKGPLKLFNNFVFTFPDDEKNSLMTVNASDGECWFSETISIIGNPSAVGSSKAGFWPIAVHYLDLLRPIKTLDEQPLLFRLGEYQLSVHHACGSFRIPLANNAGEFLSVPRLRPDAQASDSYIFEYESPGLRSILNRCNFAMANDELRPVMNGVNMNFTKDFSDYVSSDGHKLVRVRKNPTDLCRNTDSLSFIIPATIVRTLLRILPCTGDVELVYQAALMKKKVRVKNGRREEYTECERKAVAEVTIDGNISLTFYTIDGKYPRYWCVIPESHDLEMLIDRRQLVKSVQRLSLFVNCTSGLLKLYLSENELKIRSSDKDFMLDCDENLSCKRKDLTPGITKFSRFGLKDMSLLGTLKSLSSDKVVFHIKDESQAIIIKPVPQPDVEDITILLMPMLVDEKEWD